MHGILPVSDWTFKFSISKVSSCVCCQSRSESIVHLFMQCEMVRPLWTRLEKLFRIDLPLVRDKFLYVNFYKTDPAYAEACAIAVAEIIHVI